MTESAILVASSATDFEAIARPVGGAVRSINSGTRTPRAVHRLHHRISEGVPEGKAMTYSRVIVGNRGNVLLDDAFVFREAHHGRPLLDAVREAAREIDRAFHHHAPLPVERHHVIAVVETDSHPDRRGRGRS